MPPVALAPDKGMRWPRCLLGARGPTTRRTRWGSKGAGGGKVGGVAGRTRSYCMRVRCTQHKRQRAPTWGGKTCQQGGEERRRATASTGSQCWRFFPVALWVGVLRLSRRPMRGRHMGGEKGTEHVEHQPLVLFTCPGRVAADFRWQKVARSLRSGGEKGLSRRVDACEVGTRGGTCPSTALRLGLGVLERVFFAALPPPTLPLEAALGVSVDWGQQGACPVQHLVSPVPVAAPPRWLAPPPH